MREDCMRRHQYKEGYNYLLLFLLTALVCYVFVLRLGVFGAKVDWISQHSVLPDYFRRQFYDTWDLFPEFALNIGGGQNIYNFAYYGLYSPVVLLSYLLPFVKMSDYMMAAQFLCLEASVLLFYGWLRRREFHRMQAFLSAVIFLLAGPMVYHSYNQIMFVIYMPFLCLGLWGVDRYFDAGAFHGQVKEKVREGTEQKRAVGLLVTGIFLMIMTSFYYSIGGILVLVLYGLHRYFESCGQEGKITFIGFIREGLLFVMPFFVALLLSGFLLVPTWMALKGRGGGRADIHMLSLFIPQVTLDRFFYSPYGIGLTTLSVTALAAMLFCRKLHERVLAWGCVVVLTVPVFAYLLNGGLYIRDKVMIPFLPLLCYVMAYYVRSLSQEEVPGMRRWLPPCIAPLLLACVGRQKGDVGKYWELVIIDGIVMLFCFLFFESRIHKRRSPALLLLPSVIFLLFFGAVLHTKAGLMEEKGFYEKATDEDVGDLIAEAAEEENGFYRTEQLGSDRENAANLNRIWNMEQYISSVYSSAYHADYRRFREDTFELEMPFRNFLMQSASYHPLYQDFMGIKYIVSQKELEGCRLVVSDGRWKLYENKDALPIAYATNRMISEEEYEKLEFPYNQLALLEYAVEKQNGSDEGHSTAQEIADEIKTKYMVAQADVELPEKISSGKDEKAVIDIPGEISEERDSAGTGQRVLFLKFRVENQKPSKDVAVWVEGMRNKLTGRSHFYYNGNTTFTYAVLLKEGQEKIEVTFGKGKYGISDVTCFVGRLPQHRQEDLCQSELSLYKDETKGNVVAGRMDVRDDGSIITTIPYDENFTILVDGEKVEHKMVNEAFLGCEVRKGVHEVKIIYHAPGVRAGQMASLMGILIAGIWGWRRHRYFWNLTSSHFPSIIIPVKTT